MYLKWEEYMDEYRANAPESMKNVEQTAKIWWSWLPSERAFLTSAFQGMGIATILCFIILLIATRNIF